MLQLIGMETSLICLDFRVVRLKEPRGERAESVSRTWQGFWKARCRANSCHHIDLYKPDCSHHNTKESDLCSSVICSIQISFQHF